MNLTGGFDEILKVGSCEKVAEIDKFAVLLVFDIDNAPAILAADHLLAINRNCFLTANDSKRNFVLRESDTQS